MAVTVRTNYDAFTKLKTELPEAMVEVDDLMSSFLGDIIEEIRKRMSMPGDPITYPVQWDTDKQRRAFFASKGFGAGIPYHRTGEHANGWIATSMQRGWMLDHTDPGTARYLYGTLDGGTMGGGPASGSPSRIHQSRWPNYHLEVYEVLNDNFGNTENTKALLDRAAKTIAQRLNG